MRIKNVNLDEVNVEVCVIPRKSGNIVFKCQAVTDYTTFNELCPEPKPPQIIHAKNNRVELDLNNPAYIKEVEKWSQLKTGYMYKESLKATEGLEWDNVKDGDPDSWGNVLIELEQIKLTDFERNRLIDTIHRANGLSQELLEEAEEDFLASQAVAQA